MHGQSGEIKIPVACGGERRGARSGLGEDGGAMWRFCRVCLSCHGGCVSCVTRGFSGHDACGDACDALPVLLAQLGSCAGRQASSAIAGQQSPQRTEHSHHMARTESAQPPHRHRSQRTALLIAVRTSRVLGRTCRRAPRQHIRTQLPCNPQWTTRR